MRIRATAAAVGLGGLMVLSACSSSSPTKAASATTTTAASASTTTVVATTSAPPTSVTTTTSPPTTAAATSTPPTTVATGAKDLVIDDAQRTQLLDAVAGLEKIPPSEFTGLAPGETYYAYDADTQTYWAGAALVAGTGASAMQAQVSTQDDGSYYVFEMPSGGTWTPYAVGATNEPGSTCPVTVPPTVLAVWAWKPGTCVPPSH